jgi:hypothetical protein
MSALAPQDVEGAFITILRAATGVHVSTRIPATRPAKHIKVTRAGGNRANLVQERPLLIVECWAPDSVAAFQLAAEAWRALDGASGTVVAGVALDFPESALASPINMPDPDTTSPRYQFTAQPYARLKETT